MPGGRLETHASARSPGTVLSYPHIAWVKQDVSSLIGRGRIPDGGEASRFRAARARPSAGRWSRAACHPRRSPLREPSQRAPPPPVARRFRVCRRLVWGWFRPCLPASPGHSWDRRAPCRQAAPTAALVVAAPTPCSRALLPPSVRDRRFGPRDSYPVRTAVRLELLDPLPVRLADVDDARGSDEQRAFVRVEVLVVGRFALEFHEQRAAKIAAPTKHVAIEPLLIGEHAHTVPRGIVDLARPAAGGALAPVADPPAACGAVRVATAIEARLAAELRTAPTSAFVTAPVDRALPRLGALAAWVEQPFGILVCGLDPEVALLSHEEMVADSSKGGAREREAPLYSRPGGE